MSVKTVITLEEETLRTIDRWAGGISNRSRFIEEAVAVFVQQRESTVRDARDFEILNRDHAALNREIADTLRLVADL